MNDIGILVADDEARIRKLISDFLKWNGFSVLEAKDGEEALEIFKSPFMKTDLIILDVLMPKLDGWQVLSEVRKKSDIPVIMLTAKSSEQDQLNGFHGGADDYITKPFSPVVLVERVKAILKRVEKKAQSKKFCGNIRIDSASHTAWLGDEELILTPKEYDLLAFLVENKGIVLSRENILNAAWAYDYTGELRTVDTHIKQLRAKLGDAGNMIATVRGVGYRLEAQDETFGQA